MITLPPHVQWMYALAGWRRVVQTGTKVEEKSNSETISRGLTIFLRLATVSYQEQKKEYRVDAAIWDNYGMPKSPSPSIFGARRISVSLQPVPGSLDGQ